jgi:L-rhamnose isomerase
VALSLPQLLLQISRPMRWDSDHVALLNDNILAMAQERVGATGLLLIRELGIYQRCVAARR